MLFCSASFRLSRTCYKIKSIEEAKELCQLHMYLVEGKKKPDLQWVEQMGVYFSQIRNFEVDGCRSCFIGSVMSSWHVSESLSLSFVLFASWEQGWLPQLEKSGWKSRQKGEKRGVMPETTVFFIRGAKTFPETPIRLLFVSD